MVRCVHSHAPDSRGLGGWWCETPQENLKEFGRKLGKVGHGDPLTLFSTMLSQIEVYNNMIGMMVGAMKYLTDIGCAPDPSPLLHSALHAPRSRTIQADEFTSETRCLSEAKELTSDALCGGGVGWGGAGTTY